MAEEVQCPTCDEIFELDESVEVGTLTFCPKCFEILVVEYHFQCS